MAWILSDALEAGDVAGPVARAVVDHRRAACAATYCTVMVAEPVTLATVA